MEFKTSSMEQTQNLAPKILSNLKDKNVICFFGPMGSGKTVMVQSIARELGVKKNLVSPTFILIRKYIIKSQIPNPKYQITNTVFKNLWHVDLYRLDSLEEIRALGMEEIWEDKSNLVLIEWAEKLREWLPKARLEVHLKVISENERKIIIKN